MYLDDVSSFFFSLIFFSSNSNCTASMGSGFHFTPPDWRTLKDCPVLSKCQSWLSDCDWSSWTAGSFYGSCCLNPPFWSQFSFSRSRAGSAWNPAGGDRWRPCISKGYSSYWDWQAAQRESLLCSQNLKNPEEIENLENIWCWAG